LPPLLEEEEEEVRLFLSVEEDGDHASSIPLPRVIEVAFPRSCTGVRGAGFMNSSSEYSSTPSSCSPLLCLLFFLCLDFFLDRAGVVSFGPASYSCSVL
jgi:hypothetical protein